MNRGLISKARADDVRAFTARGGGSASPFLPEEAAPPFRLGLKARTPTSNLPLLATPCDVREVVKFLKNRPEGVTIAEAMTATKKRIFDPCKISAYEAWGILNRNGDRLNLAELGWEYAQRLEPETNFYRALLYRTAPHHSALKWIHQQKLEFVTHPDVTAFWKTHHPEESKHADERVLLGNVSCMFQLCQAAALGTAIMAKRGQPARLRVDRKELTDYIKASSIISTEITTVTNFNINKRDGLGPVRAFTPTSARRAGPAEKLRIFISHSKESPLIEQLRAILEAIDIETEIIKREKLKLPLADDVFHARRRCDAEIILISAEDLTEGSAEEATLRSEALMELHIALALYDRRVALLWERQRSVPDSLKPLPCCYYEGHCLTWETGLRLLTVINGLKKIAEVN